MYENYSWRHNIGWEWKEFDKHDGKNNCNTMFSRFSIEEEKHMLMLMHFRKNLYPTCTPPVKNYKNCLLQEVVHIKKRINTRKKKKKERRRRKKVFLFFMNHLWNSIFRLKDGPIERWRNQIHLKKKERINEKPNWQNYCLIFAYHKIY